MPTGAVTGALPGPRVDIEVSCRAIEIPMVFRDFDELLESRFSASKGPHPLTWRLVDDETRARIRNALQSRLVLQRMEP